MRIVFKENPIAVEVPTQLSRLRITTNVGVPVRFEKVTNFAVNVLNVNEGEILNISTIDDGIFDYDLGNEHIFKDLSSALDYAKENIVELSISTVKPDALTDHGVPNTYVVHDCQVSNTPNLLESRYVREGEWVYSDSAETYIYRPDFAPTVLDQELNEVPIEFLGDDLYKVSVRRFIVCTPIT